MTDQNHLPNEALSEVLSFLPFITLQTKALVNRQVNGVASEHTEEILNRAGVEKREYIHRLHTTTHRRLLSFGSRMKVKQHLLDINRNEQVSICSNLEALAQLPIFEHLKMDGVYTRLHDITATVEKIMEECRQVEATLQRLNRELEAMDAWISAHG